MGFRISLNSMEMRVKRLIITFSKGEKYKNEQFKMNNLKWT